MLLRPTRSTRTDTLFPYTTLFRSWCCAVSKPVRRKQHEAWSRRSGHADLGLHLGKYLPDGEIRADRAAAAGLCRSEEHTSELQSLMRISYAVFCLKKKII